MNTTVNSTEGLLNETETEEGTEMTTTSGPEFGDNVYRIALLAAGVAVILLLAIVAVLIALRMKLRDLVRDSNPKYILT